MSKSLLIVCIIALLVASTMGESAIEKLKAKVSAGAGAAPCNKAAPAAGPAAPKPFLDIRLPVVVDDYHAPVGGFNPSHIPDKEVDVAARKILREIQAADAEAKANGDEPAKADENLTLTTEEHVALKQLLLDADILIRAAGKLNAENGPITTPAAVAAKAVMAAAAVAKSQNAPAAPAAAAAAAPQVGAAAPRAAAASDKAAARGAAPAAPAAAAAGRATAAAAGAARPKVAAPAPRAAAASDKAAARAPAAPAKKL